MKSAAVIAIAVAVVVGVVACGALLGESSARCEPTAPLTAPTTGAAACDLMFPAKSRAALGATKLDGHLVGHGVACLLASANARASVTVACVQSGDAHGADGDWSDVGVGDGGGGMTGTLELGAGPTTMVQLFDPTGECVVTVLATGAWATSARALAKIGVIAATPAIAVAVAHEAPATPTGAPVRQVRQVRVTITAGGAIALDGRALDLVALEGELRKVVGVGGAVTLVVVADRAAAHARVVEVLEHAKAAGITKLAIAMTPAP